MATPDFTGLDQSQIPPDLIPPRRPGPVPVLTNDNFPQGLLPAANDASGGSQDPTTSLILKTLLPQIQQQAQQESGQQWEQDHAKDYGAGLRMALPPGQQEAAYQSELAADPKAIAQDALVRAKTRFDTGDDQSGSGLFNAEQMSAMADLVPEQARGPQGGGTATAALKELLPFVQKPMTPYEQAQVALQGREQNFKEKQFNELSANQAGTLAQRSASGGTLGPGTVDMLARYFASTGNLPALGLGNASAGMRQQILNRAGELGDGADNIAENRSQYRAESGSLDALQKQRDSVEAFEGTAKANLSQFLNTAQSVIDSGSPLLNRPLRSIDRNALGSNEQAAYDIARQVAITEIAKVLNNPNLAGQLTNAARAELQAVQSPDATLGQIYAAANILLTDMENRKSSLDRALSERQSGIGRIGSPSQPAQAASSPDGGAIRVLSPTGKRGSIPAEDWPAAQQQGYQRLQ